MNSWSKVKLSDISELITEKISIDNINVNNYISTENLIPNKGGYTQATKLPNVQKVNSYKKNDVLFSNIRVYFKKVLHADKSGGASNDVLIFRSLDNKKIDPKFLYYFLSSEKFIEAAVLSSKGTKMPRGDKDAMLKHELGLPNISYQTRLTSIISAYDELIENNQKLIKILEEMAQRLYTEWFVKFNFPGNDDVKMVDSGTEFGIIPNSWNIKDLGSILDEVFSGGTPKTTTETFWNGKHMWLSSGETRNKFISHTEKTITQEGVDKSSTKLAKANDLVVASAGQGKTRGRVSYLKNNMYINQSLICLRCDDQLPMSRFLFCNLSRRYEELRILSQTSSTRGSLTTKIISGLKVLVPSKQLLSEFELKLETIFNNIFLFQEKNIELEKMRNLLIENLVTGKRLLKN